MEINVMKFKLGLKTENDPAAGAGIKYNCIKATIVV